MRAALERNSRREAAASHLARTPAGKNEPPRAARGKEQRKPIPFSWRRKAGTTAPTTFLRSYSGVSPSLSLLLALFVLPLVRPWDRVFRFSAEIGIRDYIINIHVTAAREPVPSCRGDGRSTRAPCSRARDACRRRNRTPRAFGAQSRVLYMAGTISAFVRTQYHRRNLRLIFPPPSSFPGSLSLFLSLFLYFRAASSLSRSSAHNSAVLNTIKTFNGN